MNRQDKWLYMWQKYMDFLHREKRRPSKYKAEERDLVNWAKYNRKMRNAGMLADDRLAKFKELTDEAAVYQRINQHAYVHDMADKPPKSNPTKGKSKKGRKSAKAKPHGKLRMADLFSNVAR